MAGDSRSAIKRPLPALLFGVCLCQAPAVASGMEFPARAEGVEEIKRLVGGSGAAGQTEYQTIDVRKGAVLFLAFHNRGGVVEGNYAYVYGCDGFYCQLLGMRYSGKERLVGELAERRSALVLRSKGDGRVFLRMPLLLE